MKKDKENLIISEAELIKLSITPEKNHEFTKKLFEKTENNDFDNDMYLEDNETNYLTNSITSENSLYNDKLSFINNTSGNIYYQNTFKGILNRNNFSSNNNNFNNKNSIFRMTAIRKTNTNEINNKKYLIRSSIYDDFLKKKHPDNIKKTLKPRKRSLFSNVNNINPNDLINLKRINEGNKENEESQSESESEKKDDKEIEKKGNIDENNFEDIYENIDDINENSDNNEEKKINNDKNANNDKKENEKELGESLNIRLSLSFDDNDEDDDDEDENNINNEEDDIKLFNMIDNENDDEELIELKKLYYNVDDKEKENDKKDDKEKESERNEENKKEKKNVNEKEEEKKPKGILKKMFSKFDIIRSVLKKQIKFSNVKKTILRKASIRESNASTNNSYLDNLDKYEERLKEIDKNYQIFNDKEENLEKKSSLKKKIWKKNLLAL